VPSKAVTKEFFGLIRQAAAAGKNVVINATNLTIKTRKKLLGMFPEHQKAALVLPVPDYDMFCRRNEQRSREESKFLQPGVYAEMARLYVPPHISEGFHIVHHIDQPDSFILDLLF
jgi:predicted kinase